MIASKKIKILVDGVTSDLNDLSSKAAGRRWHCADCKSAFDSKIAILRALLKSVGENKEAGFAGVSHAIEIIRADAKMLGEVLNVESNINAEMSSLKAHIHPPKAKDDDDDLLN